MAENKISIDDLINEQFTDVVNLAKEGTASDWIDSGNYALNYGISRNFRHGYPMGQISTFYGKSGTGKSMLPAIAAKDKKIDHVIVFDSEGGGTGSSLFEFLECDLSKISYKPIKTLDSYRISKADGKIEEIKDSEVPLDKNKMETSSYIYCPGLILSLKRLLYGMEYNHVQQNLLIIVDSLSNIKSVRASLLGGEDMGKTNKLLNVLFSSLDSTLKNVNATLLFSSKVYTDLNNPYNTEGVISGGEAVVYNPSLMIGLTTLQDNPEISDPDLKAEKERRKTGLGNSLKTVRARIKKSRFGTEGRNIWIVLDATYGMTKYSGLFQLLYDFGVCVKNGSRYTVPGVFVDEKGNDISFYKKDFVQMLVNNEEENIDKLQEIMEAREEQIKKEKQNININDLDDKSDDDDEDYLTGAALVNAMEAEQEMMRGE